MGKKKVSIHYRVSTEIENSACLVGVCVGEGKDNEISAAFICYNMGKKTILRRAPKKRIHIFKSFFVGKSNKQRLPLFKTFLRNVSNSIELFSIVGDLKENNTHTLMAH